LNSAKKAKIFGTQKGKDAKTFFVCFPFCVLFSCGLSALGQPGQLAPSVNKQMTRKNEQRQSKKSGAVLRRKPR